MPQFRYSARDPKGELRTGSLQAQSSAAVADQLQDSGLIPLSIDETVQRESLVEKLRRATKFQKKADLDDLILFSRQMYSLIHAGIPITRSLRGMVDTVKKSQMKAALQDMIQELESGRQVSEAMEDHPRIFPELFTSIIQTGEASGRLDQAFLDVSTYLEREKETRMRVKTAMRYPTLVVVAIMVAVAILSLFVIPSFAKVFKSFDTQLPLPTRVLVAVSDFAVAYWPYILGAGVLTWVAFRQLVNTQKGRLFWDRTKLRTPILGHIVLRASLARFARAFSTGFSTGVPLLQSLQLTARSVGNRYVGRHIHDMRDRVERGENLTNSAAATRLFTPLVLQMLAVGEETGNVDSMLLEVADFYDREVDYDIRNLSTNIEPILITIIGAMVLILALGVFLPMWNLGTAALG